MTIENVVSLIVETIEPITVQLGSIRRLIKLDRISPGQTFYCLLSRKLLGNGIRATETIPIRSERPSGTSNQQTHNDTPRAHNDLLLRPPTHPAILMICN